MSNVFISDFKKQFAHNRSLQPESPLHDLCQNFRCSSDSQHTGIDHDLFAVRISRGILTSFALPFTTWTLVRIRPDGASRTTSVYGSSAGTIPVSTTMDAVPILP